MLVESEAEAPRQRKDFRETILEATRRIIDERGLQAATTRNIAELAGCAEGTIYRHFEDKHDLFLELFVGSAPEFIDLIRVLPSLAGDAPVRETLGRVAVAALRFYRAVLPFVGGSIVDPELRAVQRDRFNRPGRGPVEALAQLERYIDAERDLGRIGTSGSSAGAAAALIGAAFGRAYLDVWLGEEVLRERGTDEEYMSGVVVTLLEGLGPAK